MISRSPVLHLVLCSAFPILFLFGRNRGEAAWSDLPGPLLVCVGATLVLWLALGFLPGRPDAKAAALSLTVVGLFAYGHAKRAVQGVAAVKTELILVVAAVALVLAIVALTKLTDERTGLTPTLNVFAACLVALSLFQIWRSPAKGPEPPRPRPSPEAVSDGHRHPNIFYVVVDGYARDDVLRDVLGFDNGPFLRFLSSRTFVVPPRSRANYGQTDRSVASSLNMRLLGPADKPLDLIERNEVFFQLRRHGYRCVTFSSGYRVTEIEDADAVLGPRDAGWSELETVLFAMTPLPDTIRALRLPNPFRAFDEGAHRARILHTLEHLADPLRSPGPVFVFAHVVAPHPPYVFGPHGEVRERDEYVGLGDDAGWQPRHRQAYRDQLAFLNGKLQGAIDEIRSRSAEPAIILLQADHGSAFRLTAKTPARDALVERFAILNAWLAPPDVAARLYEGITPVNSFRVLFRALFGSELEPAPDRSFWPVDGRAEEDVTARVE